MKYVWDAQNRLIEAEPFAPRAGDQKVRFGYDYQGRRVRKTVFVWDAEDEDWAEDPTEDLLFLYDGWNGRTRGRTRCQDELSGVY